MENRDTSIQRQTGLSGKLQFGTDSRVGNCAELIIIVLQLVSNVLMWALQAASKKRNVFQSLSVSFHFTLFDSNVEVGT